LSTAKPINFDVSGGFAALYPSYSDTSLQPDGKTRVDGYTRDLGKGGVRYFALGHYHNPRHTSGPQP
jgi:hypothetical protein